MNTQDLFLELDAVPYGRVLSKATAFSSEIDYRLTAEARYFAFDTDSQPAISSFPDGNRQFREA